MLRQMGCTVFVIAFSVLLAGARQRPAAPGPNYVSAAEMTNAIAEAKPWPPDPGTRYKRFGAREGYSYWIVKRDTTGKAEIHTDWNDIFIVQSGGATMLTGGELKGGEQTNPGETLGGEIVGGQRQRIGPGDLFIVPAGTPHQFVVEPGASITYVTVKTALRP
jgi:mannose-6-phosphate isomerase-like protein (cupin superfamily)